MTRAEGVNTHNRWRGLTLLILLVIVIMVLAGWAVTRRKPPALVSVELANGARLELIATLTQSNPEIDLSTWGRKTYKKLPLLMQELIGKLARPSPTQVVTDPSLEQQDTTLVFVVKSGEGLPLPNSELTRAIDNAEFNFLRFNYGNGCYSETVRLEQDYTIDNGKKVIRKASISDVPAVMSRITLELVKANDTWIYGEAHKSATLVESVTIDNPLHRKIVPLEKPVSLPAEVTHGNTTVKLWRVMSHVGKPSDGLQPSDEAVRKSPTAFRASAGTGTDPHFSLAVLDVEETGTTVPEWDIANIKTVYGKSNIPFTTKALPFRNEPHVHVFGNDVGLLNQPVKLVVQLVHRKNFDADELQTVEFALPPKGEKTPSSSSAKLKFWNYDVEVIGAFHDSRIQINSADFGNEKGLTIALKHSKEIPRIMTAKLLRPDGKVLNISKHGNSSGTTSRDAGNFSYRTFDIEKAFHGTDTGNLTDYTSVTVEIVSPKFYPQSFEFVVEPTEAGSGETKN